MPNTASKHYWKVISIAGAFAGLAAWPGIGHAQLGLPGLPPLPTPGGGGSGGGQTQTLTGQASAVTAVVLGNVTSFADTGTLTSASEPLGTGLGAASAPGFSAEGLHAATMGWSDQVVSQASLGNLALDVAGTGISADFIMSTARAVSGAGGSGLTSIEGLRIGGVSVAPTGVPNQLISLPGLSVVLNEQIQSAGGIVVNALRVQTLDGLTNIVIGSAKAGI
jgi:hypothetical protein